MIRKSQIILYILLVAGILVLVNVLSSRYFLRSDFTADKRYTLSQASKDILNDISEPVTITAYISKGIQPQFSRVRTDLKDMLIEYKNASKGRLMYEMINPNGNEELENEVAQKGIQPYMVTVVEEDQRVQKKVYSGLEIQIGDQSEIIPMIQPGAPLEYMLSSTIKKLSVVEKPVVGWLKGNGEAGLSEVIQAREQLGILYEVEEVEPADTLNHLLKYKTLAIVNPRDSFPEFTFDQLNEFLARGGNLLIAMNRVDGILNEGRGVSLTTGLETWLKSKGLTVENNFIIDAQCGTVNVRQQNTGFFTLNRQIQFPYLPIVSNFSDHTITRGLEQIILQFVSRISFSGDTALNYQPLIYSTNMAGVQPTPVYFNVEKEWTEEDFPLQNIPMAAVLEGKIEGDNESKIVLIADGDFAINGSGQNAMQLPDDNVSLLVNSIDYLSDDTGLIDLRTKGITARPLEQIEDSKRVWLKWLNFLLPILIITFYGLFRAQRNRMLRTKRMEEDYV